MATKLSFKGEFEKLTGEILENNKQVTGILQHRIYT